MEPIFVDRQEMCRILNIGLTKGQELVNSGLVKSRREGRKRQIYLSSVLDYANRPDPPVGHEAPASSGDTM